MSYGISPDLVVEATSTGLVAFSLAMLHLRLPAALAVTGLKFAIPFVYFAFYFDWSWTLLDDHHYLQIGHAMVAMGYHPLSFLTENRQWFVTITSLAQSTHILYDQWNFIAQYFFGPHYYAAVFMNVVLTFATADMLYRIARLSGFSQRYAKGLMVFFLFQPELLAWSSFMNLKDLMVLYLTCTAFFCILSLAREFSFTKLALLVAVLSLFYWLRFYVPVFIFLATVLWASITLDFKARMKIFAGALVLGFVVFARWNLQSAGEDSAQLNIGIDMISGMVRMVFTPVPWQVEPNYSFLLIPSILHWLLLGPATLGGILLWRRSKNVILLIIYLMLALLLYGSFGELQGPRHRVQLIFIICWLQFEFLWSFYHWLFPLRSYPLARQPKVAAQ